MKIFQNPQDKNKRLFLKYSAIAASTFSAGWIYFQINKTKSSLDNLLDTSILQEYDNLVPKEEAVMEEIIEINPLIQSKKMGLIETTLNAFKFSYVRRLLAMTRSSVQYYRLKAVDQLARVDNLDDWHCALVANMIDPQTAVGLARSKNVDQRLFLPPPFRYHNFNRDMLVNAMRELLLALFEKSEHPCLGYFLSKVFVDQDSGNIIDHDSLELSKFIQSEKDVLPLCLESLLHHCSVERYSKDLADLNGLPLLMEIYNRFKDNMSVTIKLCQILSYMSVNRDLLQPIHKSGWIGVLHEWLHHDDVRVSVPAARALANLDHDCEPIYSRSLYVLHPPNRTWEHQDVDVVFIHGLLGGVFFTWRQRNKGQNTLGLLGKKRRSKANIVAKEVEKESLMPDSDSAPIESQHPRKKSATQYIKDWKEQVETEEIISKEYEIVWDDIPVLEKNGAGPFTCPGRKFVVEEDDNVYTYCWPKDWLANDCKNIRIIGVNYDTSLSMWAPICPSEKVKLTLDERSDYMLERFLKADLGKKPIVWITHSMGGLIVKSILSKAFNSSDPKIRKICSNTKGIVFYSTPHRGSKMANLSQATALLLWPSVEVRELRENSPQLKEIHDTFLKILESVPMKIITFVETKMTVVTAWKFNFLLVEPTSGNPGIGEYYEVPQDHLCICKPVTKQSFLYQKVLFLIKDVISRTTGRNEPETKDISQLYSALKNGLLLQLIKA